MSFNLTSNLWPNKKDVFYRKKLFTPIKQTGPHCVSTVIAILTNSKSEIFQNENINTQDPVSWSNILRDYDMKLAYCPSDIRKLKFYMDELIVLDDLFLLCYYTDDGVEILKDPDENGWICGSHVVILHRNKIIDPKRGDITPAIKHDCNNYHTKRLFRVVPAGHMRGL